MSRPLADVRVVVTRATEQAETLVNAFTDAGAMVAPLPLLTVVPPDDRRPLDHALRNLARYDLLALTSTNTIRALLDAGATPVTAPPVAVVGPATARRAHEAGFTVVAEATRADAEGLAETLLGRSLRHVLLPQASDARPTLATRLRSAGVEVTTVDAYAKRLPVDAPQRAMAIFGDQPLGWVTFTSPRIVRHFVALFTDVTCCAPWSSRCAELRAISIGPVTSDALRAAGIERIAEASSPTPEAMVEATIAAAAD